MSKFLEHINSEDVPRVPPLSHAVKCGRFVFVSGQVASGTEDSDQAMTFEDEVESVFASLHSVLTKAGTTMDRIVKINCYLSDISNRDELNNIYMRKFDEPRPARTTVGVQLAHGLRFEADAIAVLPDATE
ncbi:MAG TPA: RidA family protein [Enteractinococcus sp.]